VSAKRQSKVAFYLQIIPYLKVHEALADALKTHSPGDLARLLQSHCQAAHHHAAAHPGELGSQQST